MAEYTDLNTIHNPATGVAAPAAWGDQVRENDEALAKPYCARVRRTTAQSIPNAVGTTILWDTEDYDTSPLGDLWVPGTPGDIVVPVAGKWEFKLAAQFAINGTGVRSLVILRITGFRNIGVFHGLGNASWYVGGPVVAEDVFAAGEVVRMQVFQSSGGALNIDMAYEVWATARLVSW